ncbi:MAG: hypothetical protein QOF66_4832 [Mycobacterium sp.]|nr:hypothetical protein [Mycobacterium sp.]
MTPHCRGEVRPSGCSSILLIHGRSSSLNHGNFQLNPAVDKSALQAPISPPSPTVNDAAAERLANLATPPGALGSSDDAAGLIHQTSRGYPRAVNNLALQVLVAAFGANKAVVDESSTRAAIAEVTADWTPPRHPEHHRPRPAMSGGVISCRQILTANAAVVLTLSAGEHR